MKKWFTLIVLIFVSCTNPKPPNWYIQTPKDNQNYFYASAESYSKQNAIKNALNDIASRINVKISSNFVINKGIHNQKTYNEIFQQINAQVSNINFNNYEILKIDKENDKYYVLIRINKQKLINNLKTKINIELKKIDFNENSPIKRVIYSYNILYKLKKIKSDIFILESLGVNISNYIAKIENLKKIALNIIKTTEFNIVTNRYKNQSIEIFSKYLIISKKAKNLIKINISIQKYHLFNDYIIKGKTTIILDKFYSLTFLGKSITSYKEAEAFAKEEYKLRLLKLLKTLFKINVF
ncbi:putative lipoprotein [Nautilia profundicola AmH]|uniref:Lipoprotein n=1 Tax=Nautilia profundicola (strain ATCC BAA-1463 / DSM 18972 / AmH) TaxID=598659 RepID=B9L755_NAUPA|nr:LPP20 family lipoprotein [Nautilia profundicola]ACM92652.1 putative lipoprotein [Nautilia profundicola AmH]